MRKVGQAFLLEILVRGPELVLTNVTDGIAFALTHPMDLCWPWCGPTSSTPITGHIVTNWCWAGMPPLPTLPAMNVGSDFILIWLPHFCDLTVGEAFLGLVPLLTLQSHLDQASCDNVPDTFFTLFVLCIGFGNLKPKPSESYHYHFQIPWIK